MKFLGRRSLARRMAAAFLLSYAMILFACMLLLRYAALQADGDNQEGPDVVAYLAAGGVVRDARGVPVLVPTEGLRRLLAESPGLWTAIDLDRRRLVFGRVPAAALTALDALPGTVTEASLRVPGVARPLADMVVTSVDTEAGRLRVAAGGVDPAAIGWVEWIGHLGRSGMIWIVPSVAALGVLAVTLAVPLVLRALRPIAAQAEAIGPEHLDHRLSEERVVEELRPVAQSFNRALDRLADALSRQRRFIADTAHELRTPVGVLGAQVDLLPDLPGKLDLQRGVARLGGLVGQMLDAERLVLAGRAREIVDLVALARDVVADMAPLAVASGFEPALESEAPSVWARVDAPAIARALSNLVGNAVAHGGTGSVILVRVRRDGSVEVSDDGPGVPHEARTRVFEPFRRERWDRDGCGLGLHLVRGVMRAHGGEVRLLDTPCGATFRLELPADALSAPPGASA